MLACSMILNTRRARRKTSRACSSLSERVAVGSTNRMKISPPIAIAAGMMCSQRRMTIRTGFICLKTPCDEAHNLIEFAALRKPRESLIGWLAMGDI